MTHHFHDSLPPTSEDYQLDYEGFHSIPSWCRVRVYRSADLPPVIVATEPYEVEDSGTSITNRAELVHRLAWSRAGEPWPVVFIEHYAGEPAIDAEESWAFVTFPIDASGKPKLREDVSAGTITMVEQTPIGHAHVEQQSVTLDIGFGQPTWRHADRAAIEAAIGQFMPIVAVSVTVELATSAYSPTARIFGEILEP